MFLTRMALDTGKRRTKTALSSPGIFHGAVERAFPGERKRRLWRVDTLGGAYFLLILSEDAPDLSDAVTELGFDGEGWESKDCAPLLQRVADGSVWRFRLCANPTYSVKSGDGRGKVHAHKTSEHQGLWLLRQSEKHGFCVDPEEFGVVQSQWYRFSKAAGAKPAVSFLAVTYEGLLTVADAQKFRAALQTGIGRGKAYGAGLLTIASDRGLRYE